MFGCIYFGQMYFAGAPLVVVAPPVPPTPVAIIPCIQDFPYTIGTATGSSAIPQVGVAVGSSEIAEAGVAVATSDITTVGRRTSASSIQSMGRAGSRSDLPIIGNAGRACR
jgi:hypothetical protein